MFLVVSTSSFSISNPDQDVGSDRVTYQVVKEKPSEAVVSTKDLQVKQDCLIFSHVKPNNEAEVEISPGDNWRYELVKNKCFKNKFTSRRQYNKHANLQATAFYLNNGSYSTLYELINHTNGGIGY